MIPYSCIISSSSRLLSEDNSSSSFQPNSKASQNIHSRRVVCHDYQDHAMDDPTFFLDVKSQASRTESVDLDGGTALYKRRGPRGGVVMPFPEKLHLMLTCIDKDGNNHIVSWQPHGRCFKVHKPEEFVSTVLPMYFRQSKFTSFQRQLNLYGFRRLTSPGRADRGGYYHELFLRGRAFLCKRMMRTRVKGTGVKAATSPQTEPDFYTMAPSKNRCCSISSTSSTGSSSSSHHSSKKVVAKAVCTAGLPSSLMISNSTGNSNDSSSLWSSSSSSLPQSSLSRPLSSESLSSSESTWLLFAKTLSSTNESNSNVGSDVNTLLLLPSTVEDCVLPQSSCHLELALDAVHDPLSTVYSEINQIPSDLLDFDTLMSNEDFPLLRDI